MKNANLKVSRIAQAGSRAKKSHRSDSDMDIIFGVSGNPLEKNFYPKLMKVLKSNFPYEKVYSGSHYNVVNLDFKQGGKFELVLLPDTEFDKEYKDILDYKKGNL